MPTTVKPEGCCIILTTTGSRAEADKLAALLVERRLAACVQVTATESTYRWKEKVTREPEFLLLIKTISRRYKEVETVILENHSYEVPEIIRVPITNGLKSYLGWIKDNTKSGRAFKII